MNLGSVRTMRRWRAFVGTGLMLALMAGAGHAEGGKVTVAFQGTSWVARGVDTATVTSGNGAIINNISGDSLVTKNEKAEVVPSVRDQRLWHRIEGVI